MPVQRKVFRIEERSRAVAPADDAMQQDFAVELRAMRALLEPQAGMDRDTLDRCRAQIAEAQSYRRELDVIQAAVQRTRQEVGTGEGCLPDGIPIARVRLELAAVTASTEQSTQAILKAAEDIDQIAAMLFSTLKGGHERSLVHDIQDRVIQVFESCNFQDLTGQRVAKTLATLEVIEQRVERLMEIWKRVEAFEPIAISAEGDSRLLNGPRLDGDAGHSSQDDVDTIFGCA